MKKQLLILTFFIFSVSFGQNKIRFDYDDAGNQTRRYICPNCNNRKAKDADYKNAETIADSDLIQDDLYNQISYYPNPVREELYVKWQNTPSLQVETIELYALTGQFIKSFKDVKNTTLATIGFQSYPEGLYNLILVYNNGDRKTLKIVKK